MKPRLYNRARLYDLPAKISGRMVGRMAIKGQCSHCFPHGDEMPNYRRPQRNWKKHRAKQWKTKKEAQP